MTTLEIAPLIPSIVVFGCDNSGKPHASWFDQASAELAAKAAGMMNMRAVPVETDALRELVGTLPRGRVFSSGRAFTPFVKRQLYERLIELTRDLLGLTINENGAAGQDDAADASVDSESPKKVAGKSEPRAAEGSTVQPSKRPVSPEQIGLGSLVLGTTGPEEGWWEAEVIGINGTMLTLKWRDYPGEGTVVRRRHELGFLPTAA